MGSARVWLEGGEGLCGSIQSNLSSVHPEGWRKGYNDYRKQKSTNGSAAYNVTLAAGGMALAAGHGAGASLKLLGECLGLTFENIWSCFKGRFATKVCLN